VLIAPIKEQGHNEGKANKAGYQFYSRREIIMKDLFLLAFKNYKI